MCDQFKIQKTSYCNSKNDKAVKMNKKRKAFVNGERPKKKGNGKSLMNTDIHALFLNFYLESYLIFKSLCKENP